MPLARAPRPLLNPAMAAPIRLAVLCFPLVAAGTLWAQPTAPTKVEPGLDKAVRWIWNVQPGPAATWGFELPEAAPLPAAGALPTPVDRANSHEVRKGDALFNIAKKYGITVDQLKRANQLTSDLIHPGQILSIPTPEELAAMAPPPKAPDAPAQAAAAPGLPAGVDPEVLMLQVFLSREGFSAGPVTGTTSLDFQKLVFLFQQNRPELQEIDALRTRAAAEPLFASYTLKREDFRFIAPPRARRIDPSATPEPESKRRKKPAADPAPPPITYEDLVGIPFLAYRSPWEFVAERFRCDEKLLRALNPSLRGTPSAGAVFRVPNVTPFEIERAFESPLRPPEDAVNPVTAAIVDRSRLEVYQGARLVAVMPVSAARPGLRGRGDWKILDTIQRPQLSTRQEPRTRPQAPSNFFVAQSAEPSPTPAPLAAEEIVSAGPRNPVGILWINLAKSDSPDPLPFGLHGTSRPDAMRAEESLGGFRMPNWDIARAARLLPVGTVLRWQQTTLPTAAPAAAVP